MALLYRMGTGNGSGGDLKPFIINFTCDSGFIGKTVTMEFQGTPHAGEVVENVSGTVVSDGTKGALTLYPMHDGLWKYYVTSDVSGYQEGTITLEKWGNYPVELKDTPNGATVTPTDDVQTWLHCANVWDKQYTTVSQVVADKTTLNALVQNENANDYLVRSTTFSTTLCENNANNEAMYYLGLYDGCANKLLADDYWNNAICSADVLLADGQTHLFEKVLNVKVPTMTSNTAPSGEVFGKGLLNGGGGYWQAFNPNKYCGFASTSDSSISVGYKFANPTKVAAFSIYNDSTYWSNGTGVKNAKLQGYKSNLGWIDLTDVLTFASGDNIKNIASDKIGTYEKYQLVITSNTSSFSQHSTNVKKLQFYGREEA